MNVQSVSSRHMSFHQSKLSVKSVQGPLRSLYLLFLSGETIDKFRSAQPALKHSLRMLPLWLLPSVWLMVFTRDT